MICIYCKIARPENAAPCPNCGAPSSFQGQQSQEQPQSGPPSLLPVPYQGDAQNNYQQMQLIPAQNMGQMLPALPDQQGDNVYIPPIYTEPRPIIPRYRIISGVLSLLIITLMLCGGSVYYAKASGKLIAVNQLFGNVLPHSLIAPPAVQIPDPLNKVDLGPAHAIIPAASTASQVDPVSFLPQQQTKIFQVGAPFYVTYSVYPPKIGNVVVKWYMNDQFYAQNTTDKLLDPKVEPTFNGRVQMIYNKAASGKVELYWVSQGSTAQLAETLYFAVR